jgi:hypothetical protein
MRISFKLTLITLAALLNQCNSKYDKATVLTDSASFVTHSTALVYCQVIDNGNSAISSSGVVWNILPNPSTQDSLLFTGSEQGKYSVAIVDLEPNTTYYTRACVDNSIGISYGEEISFTTKTVSTFTDIRDNNIYTEIPIGEQVWMGENLRYNASGESYPVENEFIRDLSKFGRLYLLKFPMKFAPRDGICPVMMNGKPWKGFWYA